MPGYTTIHWPKDALFLREFTFSPTKTCETEYVAWRRIAIGRASSRTCLPQAQLPRGVV
jgi:hypothetical protein